MGIPKDYTSFEAMDNGMVEFVRYFNTLRVHQGLGYRTPDEFYRERTFPETITKAENVA